MPIELDYRRYKDIVDGSVKRDLRRYINSGRMLGGGSRGTIAVPVKDIEIPQFRFGPNQGGVSAGDGEIGDVIGSGDQWGSGKQGGTEPGEHIPITEIELKPLIEELKNQIHLPYLLPLEHGEIPEKHWRLRSKQKNPSVRHDFRRSYVEALRRGIPPEEIYQHIREKGIAVYDSFRETEQPHTQAVVLYEMDNSGSMDDELIEKIKVTSHIIKGLLNSVYKRVDARYITHDSEARDVSEREFYQTSSGGGTIISSTYELTADLIRNEYPPSAWNAYVVHFSDLYNWNGDNDRTMEVIKDSVLPSVRQLAVVRTVDSLEDNEWANDLYNKLNGASNEKRQPGQINNRLVVTQMITDNEKHGPYEAILDIFGK